jgi:hypothetical protein
VEPLSITCSGPRDAQVVSKAQVSIVEPGGSHSSPKEDETGVEALVDTPSSMESPASEQARSPAPGERA